MPSTMKLFQVAKFKIILKFEGKIAVCLRHHQGGKDFAGINQGTIRYNCHRLKSIRWVYHLVQSIVTCQEIQAWTYNFGIELLVLLWLHVVILDAAFNRRRRRR